jgi:hypothetical protein
MLLGNISAGGFLFCHFVMGFMMTMMKKPESQSAKHRGHQPGLG